ncbi:5'-methylthioadenosine/S-adenosylhomocysteine nucleosidase-like isoform X2 [Rhododendron vialii]|uniref:5'-methylthioadenosine/S-adenosylhomocysteine nucleosidase-like isoform X2 n=1 Tax=Rhododendron vialii TaxID=182163 RepID=UPI00265E5F26|nr:5'-methylthioadenosine/S-adenosylhomocysteine nucleosidase-like isoform X2 [Rhododendron vialii]
MEKITMVSETEKHPISTILIVVAMQTEVLPIVNQLQLKEDLNSMFPKGVPWVRYHGTYKELDISIVWPGKDTVLGVDSVGTISASLVTYVSIQALQPDLVINAGTAGGFKAKGATVGDTFLVSHVAFRDRRIPIPVFDLYGIGLRQAFSTPNLLRTLNLKVKWMTLPTETFIVDVLVVGKLSTSDSFEAPQEKASIIKNEATLEDMEGAAVAYVADLLKVPAVFIKAVTNIVDGDKPTIVEYSQNLTAVTATLGQAVAEVVDFINGKCLSEL